MLGKPLRLDKHAEGTRCTSRASPTRSVASSDHDWHGQCRLLPARAARRTAHSHAEGAFSAYRRPVAELGVGVISVVLSALVLWVMWQYYVNGK